MGEIVNLNRKRKEAARREAEKQAAENRVRFGRGKEELLKARTESEKAAKNLEDKKLD